MLGIDPAKLGGKREAPADPPIIWPDMRDSFALFLAMATQWTWASAGLGGTFKVGLKYEVIESVARLSAIPVTPGVFSDIRTLEAEAIRVWSKRRG